MLLVMYSHIETFSLGIGYSKSLLGCLFISFRMPLFFFISGYIAYKQREWDKDEYISLIKKKSFVQLIPTLIFSSIFFIIINNENPYEIIKHGPEGYWFTIVLFEIFFIYYTLMFLFKKSNSITKDFILLFVSIIGLLIYLGNCAGFYNLNGIPSLCLINLTRYFEFFAFGIFCRKYMKYTTQIISSEKFKIPVLILFISLFSISWNKYMFQHSYFHVINNEVLIRWAGLISAFSIIFHYKDYFEQDSFIPKSLRFIGKRTLDIYLIHYYLVPNLKSFKIECEIINNNILISFTSILLLALLLIAGCLLISSIIRFSSTLTYCCFGVKRRTEK